MTAPRAPSAAFAIALSTVALPSPLNPLSTTPPVGGNVVPSGESEGVTHRVATTEHVDVKVDKVGRPFDVRVRQRLVVGGKGDYVFVIPAPVREVVAGPGSESTPGKRVGSILWSGFNAQRKVLVANARLDAAAAAAALPLRVTPGRNTITIENATPVRVGTFAAAAQARPLASYLDLVRTALARDRQVPFGTAEIEGRAGRASAWVEAPLRVTGTVGGRRVDTSLGDGRPLRLTLPLGDGKVDLRVEPVPPLRLATPPGSASTWAEAGVDGTSLVERAQAILLRIARTRQYDQYLADPDPVGKPQTTYAYRTATPPRAAPGAAPASDGDGTSALAAVLIAAAAVAGLAGGLALWARS